MIDLKGKRELFWDTDILESYEGIRIINHSPILKNEVFKCDAPWESEHCSYGSIVKLENEVRLYYRAESNEFNKKGLAVWCLATSSDGKIFEKKNLCTNKFEGSFDNNIFHSEEREIDNFSVFLDSNPACGENERFKAVSLVSATVEGVTGTVEIEVVEVADKVTYFHDGGSSEALYDGEENWQQTR